ncbi:uncharacterized protein N7515_002070 [Penicillium bovifimosum]|uniref:Uncharacterized protein n=1 Tax=Penicillium bovifimosum TaxID=126998 RepID=A0A9W9L8X3_9EURO|nr:uncharacterized protein N7515_002070 [Penicillium bovifimosum]KAJ5143283.1 hypothetical protein N7515_002070 [Penicillium bovifimosum]
MASLHSQQSRPSAQNRSPAPHSAGGKRVKDKETSDGEETLSSDFDSDRDSDFIDPSEDGLEDEEDVVMAMYSESEQSDGNRLEGMHEIPKDPTLQSSNPWFDEVPWGTKLWICSP